MLRFVSGGNCCYSSDCFGYRMLYFVVDHNCRCSFNRLAADEILEIDVAVKKSLLLGEGFSLGSFAVLAEAVANKAAQRNLRTGAVMTDDFGRADAADHGAGAETAFLGYAVQKTGGIQIAGTGRIDDVVDFSASTKILTRPLTTTEPLALRVTAAISTSGLTKSSAL